MLNECKRDNSAFAENGLTRSLEELYCEVAALYESDSIPWVIGYSGGKDSTATLQIVWLALSKLPKEKLVKPVHVISTDTLVENPIVALWVTKSLDYINKAASEQDIPLTAHRLTPETENTFWVNLIGRGYPAPRRKFRWCTDRLKINPSNRFINSITEQCGEAIIVLGTRKAESKARANLMNKYEKRRVRKRLSPHVNLANSFVYSPIENWTNDDVWLYLMQVGNPWGYRNKDLLTMYKGASQDGECPLVVDTTTPSCGDSRFGCWVCTLVDKDKSMQAMIQNDEEKEWLLPLLELRNELDPWRNPDGDRHLRDFRRMSGNVQLIKGRPVPGPYKRQVRADWLQKVLKAERHLQETAPDGMREIKLIQLAELEEIRRIWVVEKHEIEDTLPSIYEETTGRPYPGRCFDEGYIFTASDMAVLKEQCEGDEFLYELTRELISIEKRYKSMLRRSGLFDLIDRAFHRHFYDDESDAIARAQEQQNALQEARQRVVEGVEFEPMIEKQ